MAKIRDCSLTNAWIQAFKKLADEPGTTIRPLVFSIGPVDNPNFRAGEVENLLDLHLQRHGKRAINTTANTIFPRSLWDTDRNRSDLYERYCSLLPRIKRIEIVNRKGTYFSRLVAYPGAETPINQLEHIIQAINRNARRRSIFHATLFCPSVDHSFAARQAFPCLRDVFVDPYTDHGLHIGGIYATQNIFGRAYGNLVGLERLGRFIAHETDRQLGTLECIVSRERLSVSKQSVRGLSQQLTHYLD